jgi:glucose/arabinose dehydrogenase
VLAGVVLITSACGGDDDGGGAAPRLERIAGVAFPTAMAQRPGTDDFYVTARRGEVRILRAGESGYALVEESALDVVDEVGEGTEPGAEAGLLGIAFAPDGSRLYVSLTEMRSSKEWRRKVVEYMMDGARADESTRRVLIETTTENPRHIGGDLQFGPDGYLYLGLGDHAPFSDSRNTGQKPDDLLASILRIDPLQPDGEVPYGIPPGNPFADGSGAPEVWLYGVRNPWRFSFDSKTGDLWIGDVGEGTWEEIDHLPAIDGRDAGRGENLGWAIFEGTHRTRFRRRQPAPAGAVPPVYEWSHEDDGACAAIGGYVYRGRELPQLEGDYLFADYCIPKVRRLQAATDGSVEAHDVLDVPDPITSFAQDADGEIYVLTTKAILRLEPDDD